MALGGFNSPPGGVPQTIGLPVVRGFQTQYLGGIPIAIEIGIPLDMGGASPRLRQVYYQGRFEPPRIAAVVAPAPNGWCTDLSIPLPLPKARAGFASVPFNTAQLAATVNYIGWQPNLSIPSPLPKAQQGLSNTPFISANIVTADEWQPQLSTAPSTAKVRQGFDSVPLYQPTAVTTAGWQPPLSKAPWVAKAIESNTSPPFNTAQLSANFTNSGWQQPLSVAPLVAKAQAGFSFVPFDTVQTTDVYIPLDGGNAPPSFQTVYYNSRFEPPFIPPELRTLVWQQPLSVPLPVAKAQQGYTFVPLGTVQSATPSIVVNIPLDMGGAGPRVRQIYYQSNFEPPYDTVQFIPPPASDAQLHSIPFLATMGCLLTR